MQLRQRSSLSDILVYITLSTDYFYYWHSRYEYDSYEKLVLITDFTIWLNFYADQRPVIHFILIDPKKL